MIPDATLADLAAAYGTPFYVYSETQMHEQFRAIDRALSSVRHMVCFAVKACSNLEVLRSFKRWGAGFDIVSGGELARVTAAGGAHDRTVYSGVGKTDAEIEQALAADIKLFNVESASELVSIAAIAARLGRK